MTSDPMTLERPSGRAGASEFADLPAAQETPDPARALVGMPSMQ
jgi:hypothetical protein